MTAPAITLPQARRRRRFTPDTRTAILYLLPAFIVMGVITAVIAYVVQVRGTRQENR